MKNRRRTQTGGGGFKIFGNSKPADYSVYAPPGGTPASIKTPPVLGTGGICSANMQL
jgi:hypothetical protein